MKSQRPAAFCAACLLFLGLGRVANAASLTLAWDPDSGNGVTGYVLSYGTHSGEYTNQVDVGDQTAHEVSGLAASTTYYFVVRAYNAQGQLSGPSQQVAGTTSGGDTDPPSPPSVPVPANASTGIAMTTSLLWAASTNATQYDVLFDTSNPPTAVISTAQSATIFQPDSSLVPDTRYYWQVVATGPGGRTPGPVWNFRTSGVVPPPPGVPSSPVPVDGATGVPTTIALNWAASTNATQYDVSFGTSSHPSVVSTNQTPTSYQPAALTPSTTYYWQVVAKGAGGNTPGPVWRFATQATSGGSASAVFLATDTTTQGNWQGLYGSNGYALANDATSLPGYADVTQMGQLSRTWADPTDDGRALQKGDGSDRIAAAWYGGSYTVDVNLTDGLTHQVALYVLDWNSTNRSETIEFRDTSDGTLLDTQTVTAFHDGQYWVWNVQGDVTIRITRTAGAAAVFSGLFFDPVDAVGHLPPSVTLTSPTDGETLTEPATIQLSATASAVDATITSVAFSAGATELGTVTSPPYSATWDNVPAGVYMLTATATDDRGNATTSAPMQVSVTGNGTGVPASAVFIGRDRSTKGNWIGVYGSDGYSLANDATSVPSYASMVQAGLSSWTWAASTGSVRALQKAAGSGRLAATWYGDSFTIDVNLVDGATHQVALYVVDWDSTSRSETIELLDASDGTLLDTCTVTAFHGGQYVVWTVGGHVTIRVTMTGASNAVFSGLFFDPASPEAIISRLDAARPF